MATKGNTVLTYRDLVAGRKGDGSFDSDIVELMVDQNPILDDIVITEANDGSSNKTTIRTGLPSVAWTGFYEGVQASHGSKKQVRNTSGRIKTKIEVDKDLWDQAPDKNALLLDEVSSHSEAMMSEMADCLFYGNVDSEPRKFNGLVNFYGQLQAASSTDDRVARHYVFDGMSPTQASEAALRSIWLVGWGQKSLRCFYPQRSQGGLRKGEWKPVDVEDGITTGATLEVYRQYMTWELGLDVRDYRYGGRIANVQADEMFDTTGVPNYIELLQQLVTRVHDSGVRQAFYMDKIVLEAMQVWFSRKTMGNAITYENVQQRLGKVPHIFGIPVRYCDALNTNETKVTV